MILLAGVLVVLAYLLFSTQTALLANIGQEAGREAANPLLSDYTVVRNSLATVLPQELTNAAGAVVCPTTAQRTDWAGRVQNHLNLLSQLEASRGQNLIGNFIDVKLPAVDEDGVDPAKELKTTVALYLTNGRATITDTVVFYTECA